MFDRFFVPRKRLTAFLDFMVPLVSNRKRKFQNALQSTACNPYMEPEIRAIPSFMVPSFSNRAIGGLAAKASAKEDR